MSSNENTNDLNQTIRAIVAQTVEDATGERPELTDDAPLLSSGLLDSLTILQLFSGLQDEFDIELDFEDLTEETFGTVDAIARMVTEAKQAA